MLSDYCNPPNKLHIALVLTCIMLVGELREWVQAHTEHLESVLQFLLVCLRERKLATAAATSLDQICVQCADEKKMVENFPTLLQVVQEVDSFNISGNATVSIIKGLLLLVSACVSMYPCLSASHLSVSQ